MKFVKGKYYRVTWLCYEMIVKTVFPITTLPWWAWWRNAVYYCDVIESNFPWRKPKDGWQSLPGNGYGIKYTYEELPPEEELIWKMSENQ